MVVEGIQEVEVKVACLVANVHFEEVAEVDYEGNSEPHVADDAVAPVLDSMVAFLAKSVNLASNAAVKSQTRNINFYLNKVILAGNVGSDPKVVTFDSGSKLVSFPIATSRRYKDKQGNLLEQTAWHKIKIGGNKADLAERLIKKGALIQIDGSIRYESFTAKDGTEVNNTYIYGDNFNVLAFSKRDTENGKSEADADAETSAEE
ncbi:hypothetical protein H4R24_004505 [Coemansia sp. RSA 988]|nr:hypothetical protein H4R24_004505 [Coemansia sp. RSA 988]